MRLNDDQLRALANAGQLYDTWKEVMVQLSPLPGGMYWHIVNSKEYLYQYMNGPAGQQTKSLGPRAPQTEDTLREFKNTKEDLDERRAGIEKRLNELGPVWRALRLPFIDGTAARILRALDQVDLIGKSVLVVGTYALKAYEVESASNFSAGMDATEDLDFTLVVRDDNFDPDVPRRLLLTLKQVDSSFIVSPSSSKTVVNKSGYKVDLLTNNLLAKSAASARPWKPEPLEGQEWLLLGKPVHAVLIDSLGWPVALSAPDPRYFALHKIWLSKRPGRPGPKRVKDERQGRALLEAIYQYMPHYPIDDSFIAKLPNALREQLPNTRTNETAKESSRATPKQSGT